MTLLFVDGFDYYLKADAAGRYNGVSYVDGMVTGRGGKAGTQAIYLGSSGHITKVVGGRAKLMAGIAVKQTLVAFNPDPVIRFLSGGVVQVGVLVNGLTGEVIVYKGAGTTNELGRCPSPLRAPYWFHLAVEVVFHQTAGSVRVAVNGAIVLTLTGKNTDPENSGQADEVKVTAAIGGDYVAFDDLYIADGLGAVNNQLEDFGDLVVLTQYPTSDAAVTWSRSAGSNNYENVDELQEDGDATYNYSATPTNADVFGCPAIAAPAAGAVVGVQVNGVVKKTDGGSREFALIVESDGVESQGPEVAPGTSYQVYSHLCTANPDGGGAWDLDTAGAARIGIRVTE